MFILHMKRPVLLLSFLEHSSLCNSYRTEEVAIWIQHRKNVPVVVFLLCVSIIFKSYQSNSSVRSECASSFSTSSLDLKMRFEKKRKKVKPGHEGGNRRSNPLVSVNTSVNPHCWSIPTPTFLLANLPFYIYSQKTTFKKTGGPQ